MHTGPAILIGCAVLGLSESAALASAQQLSRESGSSATQAVDSAAAVRRARTLQGRFETRRRHRLPRFYSGAARRCVTIGRFCYWSSGTANHGIPDEGDIIRRARAQLLRDLEATAREAPSSDWVVGQRIRYLVEARDTSAVRVARECASTGWWCDALMGYTLHTSGDFAGADSGFARALAAMPSPTRCEWTDISRLLGSEPRAEYRRLSCEQREAKTNRMWWLADPLFITPGNERRTEHFSRVVYAELQKKSVNTHGMSWGWDLAELGVRFGWPEKWTQHSEASIHTVERPTVAGHDREPAFHFLPTRLPPDRLELVADSVWELKRAPPQEQYSPSYARRFTLLDAQVARFRRGDSTLVVAAYDVGGDTLFRARRFSAALVSAIDEVAVPSMLKLDSAPVTHVLMLTTASQPQLVGVELLSDSVAAARWRYGYGELSLHPDGISLSDLLFVDVGDGLPDDLAGAIPRAHGGTVFNSAAKIGLFWELYGKAPIDSAVPVSLTLSPIEAGFFRKALRVLRIAPKATPLNIRWQENGASGVLSARSVLLDLSLVPPGKYELTLEVGADRPARASRIIRVR